MLNNCPFCGSDKIDYSIKTSGYPNRAYHACMYCKSCHTYGPRVRFQENTLDRYSVERNESLRTEAEIAWNKRCR